MTSSLLQVVRRRRAACRFSLAALRAAKETLVDEEDSSKGHVQIRIGVNSGPCMVTPYILS